MRPQLQIDVSRELKMLLKAMAYGSGKNLRQFVLEAIAQAHPGVKDEIKRELR